ncbi:hypothetical protein SLA2020_296620 [Shorea laevis]
MKFLLTALFGFLLNVVIFLPLAIEDLESDKQALLNFAASVPHGRKLNWNTNSPVCTSWVDVTCTRDGTRVVALRLLVNLLRPTAICAEIGGQKPRENEETE